MRAAAAIRGSMPTTPSAWNRKIVNTYAVNAERATARRLADLNAAVSRVLELMGANGHQMGPIVTKRSGTGAVCSRCGAWACVRQTPREVARNGNYAVFEWDLTDVYSDAETHCLKIDPFVNLAETGRGGQSV